MPALVPWPPEPPWFGPPPALEPPEAAFDTQTLSVWHVPCAQELFEKHVAVTLEKVHGAESGACMPPQGIALTHRRRSSQC